MFCMRPGVRGRALLLVIMAAFLLSACSAKEQVEVPQPPVSGEVDLEGLAGYTWFNGDRTVEESRLIDLRTQGLHSWHELEDGLRNSLAYVAVKPWDKVAIRCEGLALTWGQLRYSLEHLLGLLPKLDRRPELLAEEFRWFELSPNPLMTGYCTPEIEASLTPRAGYKYPIYGRPPDLHRRNSGQSDRPKFYRVQDGIAVPYYKRAEVDQGRVLAGRGLEIAWAKDLVDVFYLHVEGAGMLRLPDGSSRFVTYAASNGHKFKGLGAILRDRGLLPANRLGQRHVREYFRKNPERMHELMAENESYVFFALSDKGALGATGRPLEPMVSVAVDTRLIPLGALLVLETVIPGYNGDAPMPVRGLALAHDTGGAIKGSRLDYYTGVGHDAENTANRVYVPARVRVLVSREALGE